ncbi:MAG TPA: hypothetical protein VLF79_02360 [Candidatus Saccharimonadales bacterium]|nr:hypothetical protein [Candidatus Saccharimonadales bacterium]
MKHNPILPKPNSTDNELNFSDLLAQFKRMMFVALAALIVVVPILIISQTVTAAQITNRSVLISTAQAGATANFTFTFTPGSTTQIQSIKFQACTTALGTCTPGGSGTPTGINLSGGTISKGGTWGGATNFSKDTSTTGCTTVDTLCVTRSDTTSQALVAHSIIDTGAINQDATNCSAAPNCTFFIRMTTFSDGGYTTTVDAGTMASSTTQLFTVNAAIQEVLTFCIGATSVDDSNTTTPPLCALVSGTSLNLGTLNSSNISVSPVSFALAAGDGNNGIAELSTNATNGSTVSYDAIQQSGTNHAGTLRVAGASCNAGNINTDQCINAIGTSQSTVTAGTEAFGMTIAAINCKATTAYSCSFTGGTYKLSRDAAYDGTGANTYPTDTGLVGGTTNAGYAWDETGTTTTIATSPSVVDKEAMILKFAATPNIITPTGSYTSKADFVATPTY